MTHWHYIALAYGAFAALMLWDFLMPRLALGQSIRRLQLKLRRNSA
jgi:Heme exporter protein D (CcmD)